jgi:hypothetical protein
MIGVDTPLEEDLPAFVEALSEAVEVALQRSARPVAEDVRCRALEPFTWRAVFRRVEAVWLDLL